VLGCTHYPFLRKSIRKLLGETITLIDTSDAVIKQLERQLETLGLNPDSGERGSITFMSSKNEASLLAMAKDLLSSNLNLHTTITASLGDVS
jgi:glutamate racemase